MNLGHGAASSWSRHAVQWCATLLILAVACSNAEPDHAAPQPHVSPLVPETEYRLPPPPGAVRIEWLDVDVFPTRPVRGGGKMIRGTVLETGAGCRMVLHPTSDPDAVLKMVGTLPIWVSCHNASLCGDFCESRIVPVPFGTAFEVQPVDPPIIHLSTTGGFSSGRSKGVRFWKDGSVQFYGPRCRHWRGLRRQLTPVAVEDLLADFERAGVLDSHQPEPIYGPDEAITTLRILDGDRSLAVTSMPLLAKAVALIEQAVGYNLCIVDPAFVKQRSTSTEEPVPIPERSE